MALDDTALAATQRELAGLHRVGTGSPEGVVTAPRGAHFHRLDGGAATCLYVKEGGGVTNVAQTNTGWVAK